MREDVKGRRSGEGFLTDWSSVEGSLIDRDLAEETQQGTKLSGGEGWSLDKLQRGSSSQIRAQERQAEAQL